MSPENLEKLLFLKCNIPLEGFEVFLTVTSCYLNLDDLWCFGSQYRVSHIAEKNIANAQPYFRLKNRCSKEISKIVS
ncbi:hypothetical protein L596_005025 [Steinernema carpocapsae]|uniref:Uncharacterized protein n=1 Tax=Steinernema carpocapsae TaxID=34508 RepID=A0A4U8UXL9_STECR|nr:hypothetical protein L596_005025 [Steinernema carpocapsae]